MLIFRRLITVTIFCAAYIFANAQENHKLYFELDVQSKFSFGDKTYQTIRSELGTKSVNDQLSYNNPVFQLGLIANYQLSNALSIGIGSGINFTKFIENTGGNSNYDKVAVPVFLQLKYSIDVNENWCIAPNLQVGYQFTESNLNYYYDRWSFEEQGGILGGFDLQIQKKNDTYSPYIRVGVEYNQFDNKSAIGYYTPTEVHITSVSYTTQVQLLKVGLGFQF